MIDSDQIPITFTHDGQLEELLVDPVVHAHITEQQRRLNVLTVKYHKLRDAAEELDEGLDSAHQHLKDALEDE